MVAKGSNKMEDPIRSVAELDQEVEWDAYEHKREFEFMCDVIGDRYEERLVVGRADEALMKKSCVYIMEVEGKVLKIGTALRGIKGRIGSYNTGKVKYRARGTNSGANYWMLHSIINLAVPVRFHGYFPPLRRCLVFGTKVKEPFPSAKTVEGVLIKLFVERYGRKPIGNMQA